MLARITMKNGKWKREEKKHWTKKKKRTNFWRRNKKKNVHTVNIRRMLEFLYSLHHHGFFFSSTKFASSMRRRLNFWSVISFFFLLKYFHSHDFCVHLLLNCVLFPLQKNNVCLKHYQFPHHRANLDETYSFVCVKLTTILCVCVRWMYRLLKMMWRYFFFTGIKWGIF